jgi:peptide/nickel transport system permease protein
MHILFRHLLPNAWHAGAGLGMLAVGDAIILEATLGFFGLGAQPPVPSWGAMMSAARRWCSRPRGPSSSPAWRSPITVVAINLYGDALIAALDIRPAAEGWHDRASAARGGQRVHRIGCPAGR